MALRIVFMGSPNFALPSLRALHDAYSVAGVVTQPDRPAGRGRMLKPPPVKTMALELGLPFIQPARLRDPEAMVQLRAWSPDLIVVAAYGQILRQDVLDLPGHGCLNVHASLLPRWRGASPVHHAILHGDAATGITIMRMDAGLDTGPLLSQAATPVLPTDTTGSLSGRLAAIGAALLVETLPGVLSGRIIPKDQDSSKSTYAPLLRKPDGLLDFSRGAAELERQVRAFQPWPGTHIDLPEGALKIHQVRVVPGSAAPGERFVLDGFPAIGTGKNALVFEVVQPPGKPRLAGDLFLRGSRNW